MLGQETRDIERKISAILKILNDSSEPIGSRIIARRLKLLGINLSERAVRYHLRTMDEKGLTRYIGQTDGRSITQPGIEELRCSLVCDKVGFVTSKIELLSYLTTIDIHNNSGTVPIDIALFNIDEFSEAIEIMKDVFASNLCTSNLVAVAHEGERLGEINIPEGKIGLATICSIVVNGLLLKQGIPINSKFGGLVQVKNYHPLRFIDLIEYSGSTIDPLEIFITSKMTSVLKASRSGEGKLLATFNEIPLVSKPAVEHLLEMSKSTNLCKLFIIGGNNELLCDVPAKTNEFGLVLFSGLNPVAATSEAGIHVICKTMCGMTDISRFCKIESL